MNLTIIKQLKPKIRRLYRAGGWREVKMSAYVGALGVCSAEREPQFGIGLIEQKADGSGNSDKYLFWEVDPARLVTAWRAMQVVDMATDVRENLLRSAMAISERNQVMRLQWYMEALRKVLPYTYMPGLRANMLEEQIADEELDEMLAICKDAKLNIKVCVQELEEELVAGVIHCTPGVREVFDRAELAGQKLLRIEEASKKPVPTEQSLSALCLRAKIKGLQVHAGTGVLADDGAMNIDQRIIYAGYRYGARCDVFCAVLDMGLGIFAAGNPVVRLENDSEWILYEAFYQDQHMYAKARGLSGYNSGRDMTFSLAELAEKAPRLVGVTFEGDEPVSERDRERGYISTEKWWQKLRRRR